MAPRGPGDESRLVASVLQAFEEAGADFEPVLDLVCALGCELTGDPWVIRLVGDDARLQLGGAAAGDAEVERDLRATVGPLRTRYSPTRGDAVYGQGPVLLTHELFEAQRPNAEPEFVALAERRGLTGGVLAPMRVRGRVVGVLWWACGAHDGDHDEDDVRFASSVADRCALAIDNAKLLRSLEAERNRHAVLLAQISDAVCIVDADGVVRHVTPGGATRILGWEPAEVEGTSIFDLVHRGDHEYAMSGFLRALGPDDWQPLVLRVRHKDGTWRHLRVSAQNLLDDPAVEGVVVTARDVTDQVVADRLLSEENDILERVATGAPLNDTLDAICRMVDGHVRHGVSTIWLVDDESGVLVPTAGPNAGPLPNIDPEIGRRGVDFALSLPSDRIWVSDVRTNPEWEPWREQAIASGIGGSWNRPIRDAFAAVYGMVIVYRNELRDPKDSERQAIDLAAHLAAVAVHRAQDADRLAHAATHDVVTDLPNRRLFLERLEQAVNRQRRGARPPSVLFIDLDRFKQINDRAGHTAGDEALRVLAERLLRVVRPTDVVARLGGDEFAVLCDETGEEEAVSVAARLLTSVCEPMELAGRVHHLSASIGVAAGRAGVGHDALVRCADVAMYRAKAHGAGGIVAFRSGMADRGRNHLEQDLRHAVEQRAISVHYQPILSLSATAWIAVEALARWRHPHHGWIAPSTFVPLAEEVGLAGPLGDCVLEQVCADAARWAADPGMADLLVGVNVSARQLTDPRFISSVERLVASAGIDGARLFVELTETSMMEEFDVARAAVAAMERLGISLVIDDFGTGHSTLSRLRQFPATGLKLDRSFVAEIGEDSRSEDIVAAVVQLAHAVGMAVCAEGIETTHQLATVKRLGVDVAQGYLLARPMPADDLRALIVSGTAVLAPS